MARWCVLPLLAAVLAGLGPASGVRAGARPANPDPDIEKLQGKWKIVYHETAGEEDTDSCRWVMTVKGSEYAIDTDGDPDKGVIRLDSSKSPKLLEYEPRTGGLKGKVFVGIYTLEGGLYATCDVEKGSKRPLEFHTTEETGQVAIWKRVRE